MADLDIKELDIDSTLLVEDEDGNEHEYEILFTFEKDDSVDTKYVLYYDPNEEEPSVMASLYDEEGNLYPVESEEEWDMIEEVFNAFIDEEGE